MVWVEIHIYPCGVELPQIHPGFTELSYILQGQLLLLLPVRWHAEDASCICRIMALQSTWLKRKGSPNAP